jgi:hypothetical protein
MTDERGMVPADEWAETPVGKASTYHCGKCGMQLESPQAVYDHIDAEHPKERPTQHERRRNQRPANPDA